MRASVLGVGILISSAALAAPAVPPREEAAPPIERPGETDDGHAIYPPLRIPEKAARFADPTVSDLAAKLASGSADLRDRRAWYMINLLYAPFDVAPPASWRRQALDAGEAISIEARRRKAALRKRDPASRIAPGSEPDAALNAGYSWSSLGPTNYTAFGSDLVQGRATVLWVNPVNVGMIFAGFAGGGVWKTSNSGLSWTPLTDFQVTTSVGGIDIVPGSDLLGLTNATIYVGLGEGNTASDSIDGAGVLKSTNGGTSWTLQNIPWAGPDAATSARFRHSIRRVLVDTNVV